MVTYPSIIVAVISMRCHQSTPLEIYLEGEAPSPSPLYIDGYGGPALSMGIVRFMRSQLDSCDVCNGEIGRLHD